MTAMLVAKIKRSAEAAAPTHAEAHEHGVRDAGFHSWHQLLQASQDRVDAGDALPVDAPLRPSLDDTPNEARSDAELDEWRERPYA